MKQPALAELRAAATVAAHRSFRAAARELGISASALSRAIAVLEQRLGLRLFHRTTRSVAVTAEGERFFERVRPALRELTEAIDNAHDTAGPPNEKLRGKLRINASHAVIRYVLMPLIGDYLERYPEVSVELTSEARLVDIVAEGYDLGVREPHHVPRDMIAVPCSDEIRFVIVGAPAYFAARKRPTRPADLLAHACLRARSPTGSVWPWELERRGKTLSLQPRGPLLLDDDELVLLAARRGLGLAYAVEWAVADDLKSGALVRVLPQWSPTYPGLCLYYPGHRLVPAPLRAFVDLVRARRKRT